MIAHTCNHLSSSSSSRSSLLLKARVFELSLVLVLLAASANTPGHAQAQSPAASSAQSPTQAQQPQAPNAISGIAFRDKNSDGKRDAGEPGVVGIVVTAFGADGTTRGTANTASDGSYSLAATGAGPYRVEFTNFPLFMRPGPQGADSGTTVQFVPDGNATNINVNFVNPDDFVGPTVNIATTLFVAGSQTGTKPSLVGHPYAVDSPTGVEQFPIAYENQLGTTHGLAYQRSNKTLYAAAFTKRGTGFGPGGIGAIYKVPISGTPSVFINLGSAAGSFTRPRDLTPDPPDFDSEAITLTGKSGFGDLDITEDETALYTINLANRSLYRIDVQAANAAPGGTAGVSLIGQHPDPGCVTGVARPFALEIKDGVVYVGGVCTGELGPTAGNTDTVEVYVYTYTFPSGWGTQPVLRFNTSYPTTCADVDPAYDPNKSCNRPGAIGSVADWWSWADFFPLRLAFGYTNTYTFNSETEDGFIISPAPILSDIEIDGTDMILGLRDRFGDQAGWDDPGPDGIGNSPFGQEANMRMVPKGDILRASPKVTATAMTANGPEVTVLQWQIEGNASGSTFGPGAHPNDGSGPCNGVQGPNGENCGEFYDDNFNPTPINGHDEIALGALAQVEGAGEVVTTAYDPFVFESAGTIQMSRVNGTRVRGFQLFEGGSFRTLGDYLNKANGMGDLEVLTEAAPVELGNLVWRDSNTNGLQDPGEPGIAGVTVSLFRPGVGADCVANNADDAAAVAKAVTDAKGEYYFRTGAGADASQTDSVGVLNGVVCGVTPFATYAIKLDNAPDFTTDQPLGGLFLTEKDDAVPSPGGSNRSDSDAALEGGVPVISYTLGGPGGNDHRLDFGFVGTIVTPTVISYSLGNEVWLDANNSRSIDTNETGLAGITLTLHHDANANGAIDGGELSPTATTATNGQGFFLFTVQQAGSYAACVAAANFGVGGALGGYLSSGESASSAVTETVPANPDGDADNDDNGTRRTAAGSFCAGGVGSALMSVTGNEPATEVPANVPSTRPGETPGIPDTAQNANSNVTLDFGFYVPASLGNRVWFDVNKNGRQDAGEEPVAGVTVTLRSSTGAVLSTTVTKADGLYAFTKLPPDTYTVCFVLPPGRGMTTKGGDSKSDTDSNANPSTNCTDPVTLASGENNPTLDVGMVIISPQAVKLTAFSATASNGGIKVAWTTGSEINTFGFVLYRAETNERGSAVLVTTELIPAKGASSYAYLDATAAPNTKYSYWLIETETSGAVHEYGPLQTELGADGTDGTEVSVVVQPNGAVVAGGVPLAVRSTSASVAAEMVVLKAPSNAPVQSAVQVMAQAATQAVVPEAKQQVHEEAPDVEFVAEVPEMSAASLSTPVEASEAKTDQEPAVPVVEQSAAEPPIVAAAPAIEVEPPQGVVAVGEAPSVATKPVASQRLMIGVMWIVMGLALVGFVLTMILGVCLVALAKRRRA